MVLNAAMSRLNRILCLYLTALFLGYIFTGWLLSDCKVPWLTWAGTQAVTVHLAWVGFDAVALAIAWIVGLVWAGVFSYTWPQSFPPAGVSVWAVALAVIWILGLLLVLTLAQAKRVFASIGWNKSQAFWLLVFITSVGLGLGRLVDIAIVINEL